MNIKNRFGDKVSNFNLLEVSALFLYPIPIHHSINDSIFQRIMNSDFEMYKRLVFISLSKVNRISRMIAYLKNLKTSDYFPDEV